MLNSFEISQKVNNQYSFNYKLNDELVINYNHEDIFNSVIKDNSAIISYGYCFDVRNPKQDVKETLSNLLNNPSDILGNIKYLNGHFVLVFKTNNSWKLITDAAGMTPVYFDAAEKIVTVLNIDTLPTLNGVSVLDLQDFTLSRINLTNSRLADERIERTVLDLVSSQYKYFLDKDLTLNFRRNKMNKAIISILRPALMDQTLNLRENDELTVKIGNWMAREYKLNILEEDTEPSSTYLANTHLMNYSSYMNKDIEVADEELNNFNSLYNLNDENLEARSAIEYNLLHKLNYRSEQKSQLIYDPFNVLAIQEIIYSFKDAVAFEPLERIIKIMHPAIDFYDFAEGVTLLQKYTKMKKQNQKMSEELKKVVVNQEFLREAETQGISVSENLNGKILDKGITVHPVSQLISKDDIYEITYVKNGPGMILVETYFNNPKNAHRIKVELNNELFNIDEFLEGKFIQAGSEINIKMYYERNYDAASWQKAGKITVKEID